MDDILVLKPRKGLIGINLKELFRFRELLFTLAQRDLKVRYKQTIIGGLWAILQPTLTMVIFSLFFGSIIKVPSDGYPYAIFSYSGLLLWVYFSKSLEGASNSMIYNAPLITKVYFPRILIPLSATLVGLLDYLIASTVLIALMVYYHVTPSVFLPLILIVVLLTWMLAAGMGFFLSALNVKYRDVRHAIPFFIQMLIFITPVIYPVTLAGKYAWILMLNPMTGLIESHRAFILNKPVPWGMLGVSALLCGLIFVVGLIYFRSVERHFADDI